jgi:hypothetical protein
MRPIFPSFPALLALVLTALAACSDDPERHASLPIARDGAVDVDIVFAGEHPGLTLAANDLADVLAYRSGATRRAPNQKGAGGAIVVVVDPSAELDPEGFELIARHRDRPELEVRARTEVGAAYGLWGLAKDLGARWFHPEDAPSFLATPNPYLPWPESPVADRPDFALRGFHEHTQHPTVASDIFLRPDFEGGRDAVSRQLRWLARNRQNILTVHFLSTVDLSAWTPYMADIVDEARGLGVAMGVVIGFTDQQQHAFRLVRTDLRDDEGQPIPPEQQIRDGLDKVLASGIEHVVFQIGTSEFTAPDPAITVAWLDAAVDHIVSEHPSVTPHAWIHITCNLLTAEGKDFFHTPLMADPALGAWVHTTMFYTLRDPAPVYDCEDFTHQLDFLAAAQGQREQTFFPESAWWLGFDNNLPLLLPITGVSRERDIADIRTFGVTGHVTFTTGREHLYWMYDHYVAWAAWDADLTWSNYLRDMRSVWTHGETVAEVLTEWTELQVRDLYETNPEIFFYLAGELPQDEVGVLAGVIARRPKLALKTVRDYGDAEFSQWKTRDYDLLLSMREDYAALFEKLPGTGTRIEGEATAVRLYREVHRAAKIHLQRIEHAIAIYGGVIAARANERPLAEQRLSEARAISEAVRDELVRAEADYRDPVEWLARLKPESLTVYPFGYLYETSTAYFWTRRDDQLANLITATFDGVAEAWPNTPLAVFFAERETTSLTAPASEVAASIIVGLVPRVLVAVTAIDTTAGVVTLQLATDHNKNGLPDEEPLTLSAVLNEGRLTATAPTWVLPVRDAADELLGRLVLRDSEVVGELTVTAETATAMPSLELTGEVLATDLITMVQSVAGIDRVGIENLMKDIWQLDPTQPLPARLPFGLALSPTPAP